MGTIKKSRFNKINTFYWFIKAFLSETVFFKRKNWKCMAIKNTMTTTNSFMSLPWFICWYQRFYPPVLLPNLCKCQHWKNQIMPWLLWKCPLLHKPIKLSHGPPQTTLWEQLVKRISIKADAYSFIPLWYLFFYRHWTRNWVHLRDEILCAL